MKFTKYINIPIISGISYIILTLIVCTLLATTLVTLSVTAILFYCFVTGLLGGLTFTPDKEWRNNTYIFFIAATGISCIFITETISKLSTCISRTAVLLIATMTSCSYIAGLLGGLTITINKGRR